MHVVAVRPVVIVVGAIEINASVELDPGRIRCVAVRDDRIICARGTDGEDREQNGNENRGEDKSTTHRHNFEAASGMFGANSAAAGMRRRWQMAAPSMLGVEC